MSVKRLLFAVSLSVVMPGYSTTTEVPVDLKTDVRHFRVHTTGEKLQETYRAYLSDAWKDTCVEAKTTTRLVMMISMDFSKCERVSSVRVYVKDVNDKRVENVRVEMRQGCDETEDMNSTKCTVAVSEGYLMYTCGKSCRQVTVGVPDGVTVCGVTVYRVGDDTQAGRMPSTPLIRSSQQTGQDKTTRCPNIPTVVGQSITLHCESNGYPSPEYRWQSKRGYIPNPKTKDDDILELTRLSVRDSGQYRCIAGNSVGMAASCVNITVHEPISRTCELTIIERMSTSFRFRVDCLSSVVSHPPDCQDMHFVVSYRPSDSQHRFYTKKVFESTTFELDGLTVHTNYDIKLRAVYKKEYCSVILPVEWFATMTTGYSPPPQPVDVRVHDVNETTADVRWNQPEQPERLKVKNEIIVRNETDMHTFMEDVQSGRQHVILRELTPITKYTVRVIAINVEQPEIQQSDMIRATSEPIEVVTTGPAPINVKVFTTATSAVVRWDIADILRTRDVTYIVEYSEMGKKLGRQKDSVTKKTITLKNLKSYTMYNIEVWAKVGSLPTEKISQTFRTAEAAPGPPQDVRVVNVGSRMATVLWSPPSHRNGRLMEYRVFVVHADLLVSQLDVSRANVTVSNSTLTAGVSGLLPGTSYRVWVVAVNGMRSRELIGEFAMSTFTTNTEASSPPHDVSYFNLTFSSVVITWHKPLALHGTMLIYDVSFVVSGRKVQSFSTKEVSQYVDRLEAYTHYRVHVRAGTLINRSSRTLLWSDPGIVNIMTRQTFPSQPLKLRVPHSGVTSRSFQLRFKKPDSSNGNIQFYRVYLWEKQKPSTTWMITREIPTPDDSLSTNVTGLSPFTAYRVSLAAVNVEDGKELVGKQTSHMKVKVKTLDEAPTAPFNCTVLDHDDRTLHVSWKRPHPADYKVVSYNLTYVELPYRIGISSLVSNRQHQIVNLLPYTKYNITITAITNNTAVRIGPSCSLTARTKIGSLPTPTKPRLADSNTISDDELFEIIFPDVNAGDVPIHSVEVVVVEINPTSLWLENMTLPSHDDDHVVDMYVAKEMGYDDEVDRVVIGTGDGNDRLLKANTTYAVYIRFVSLEDDQTRLTSVSSPLILTTTETLSSSSSSSGLAVWIGAAIAVVVALSLIVAIVLLIMTKRNMKPESHTEHTNKVTQESDGTQNGDTSVKEVPVVVVDEKDDESTVYAVATVVTKDDNSSDSVIKEFEQHVKNMKAANNEGFINEFDGLSDVGIDQSSSFGRKRENKKKNRYQNIVPYDGKCVMLEELAGMSKLETEYINATCIDGFERRDSYIVAQGPLPATCHDFWRMVWLKEPSAIVMLTRTVENGKNKCKQYWLDNEPVHYDGLTIEVESITDLADYTVRLIKMTLLDEKRSIKHYHFKSWPDHGVPTYATDLLGLLYRVRRDTSGSPSPLLVHCSAGVGRSGTYVTIDFIVDCLNLKPTQKIDVCRVVTDLRMSRKEMVQSVLQYSLIHEAIVEAYYTQKNSLLASEFRNEFLSIASMQVGGGRIGEEHKALLRLSSCPDESDYMSALLPTVLRRKNRTSQFLPPDSVRVMLHVDDDSLDADYVNTEEGADYINASYVNSYSARKAFIVTQAPLPSTKIDMWKMVYEQNVTAIVNLAQHDEHDIYWPESGSCTYGHLKVKTTSVELKNAFLVYRLHLTKNMDERDITLFHYTAWPVDGTPSNVRGLFRMMSELDQWQKRHSGCRIVVHCCTGMGRSGVFCATYNVLEQVQNEGVVNILHVAKFLCNQRPGIIQTLEHYHSIYSLVDHYLRSDTIYSNVK